MRATARLARTLPIAGLVLVAACRRGPAPAPFPMPPAGAWGATSADELRRRMSDVLARAVADSAFPGGIVVAGRRSGVLVQAAAGRLDAADPTLPSSTTLWDLASLTKVVGLTSAVLQLVQRGMVDLDAPVQRYLPDWGGPDRASVTLRHLLTHASGLPAWRPLYKEAAGPAEALALALSTAPDTFPGTRMVYSDLGAIVLGQVVARVAGRPLDAFVTDEVFRPLGMGETLWRPPIRLRPRIAPTEVDPWRQRHLRGEVHDENAFALGGVSSHAGLFSTAEDLSRLALAYLNHGSWQGAAVFDSATIERFTARPDSPLSHRALGWEKPTGTNSGGRRLSPRAFGHTGFTGTSLWIDPGQDVFVLLLTNRVNPTRENRKIGAVRMEMADAVLGALQGCAPRATVLECPVPPP